MLKQIKNVKKKLLKKFVRSTFLKTKINFVFIMFLTMVMQFHINTILSYLLVIHPYIDFFNQIIITIIISMNTNRFLNFVLLFEKRIYDITRYFINHYSSENYLMWKRKFILGVSSYIIVILLYCDFNKHEIILQIIQTIISFLILDRINSIETRKPKEEIKTTREYNNINHCVTYSKVYDKKGKLKIRGG